MLAASNRDPLNLRREDLLEDYFDRARLESGALAATALRTRSMAMRDIFVRGALHLDMSSEQLKRLVLSGKGLQEEDVKDFRVLAELGRVILLQDFLDEDAIYGEYLLTFANEFEISGTISMRSRRVLIQHHIVKGNLSVATQLLDQWPDISEQAFGYLWGELQNPFINRNSGASSSEWLDRFNRPFAHYGLLPVELSSNENLVPFDRLRAPAGSSVASSERDLPLVSVVLTVFKPDENRLLTSVHSILNQTWENFELLIVNDCSGAEYRGIFDRLEALDSRISVIHADQNRGTYIARNLGYAASKGDYITGQDDDDWSHPERLERQVAFLESNLEAIGCRVSAIRCDENLGKVRVGSLPHGQNASSLFIRRQVYEAVGGFLPARKAADTEYHYRIEKVFGCSVVTLQEPLSIIRLLQGSLSRGDFGPEWKHSSRRSFRSAYEHWHANSALEDLTVVGENASGVEVPRRFRIHPDPDTVPQYDVVFAGDWEHSSVEQHWVLEEIYALSKANYRIGIMNLESPLHLRVPIQKSLINEVQYLINVGTVDEVFYDDASVIGLLLLRQPPILQFLTDERSNLKVSSIVVAAEEGPASHDGSDIRYLVQDCHNNAISAFGVSPIWMPKNSEVREYLGHYLSDHSLAESNIPRLIDVGTRWHTRMWYRSIIPVVGYLCAGYMQSVWDPENVQELGIANERFDVRIRCDGRDPRNRRISNWRPSGCVVYESEELTVDEFVHSLDYFVLFQTARVSNEWERIILEAVAAGVVVILSRDFEPIFGEAAIYTEPESLDKLISALHSDFSMYKNQLEQAKATLDTRFSYHSYEGLIQRLLTDQRV